MALRQAGGRFTSPSGAAAGTSAVRDVDNGAAALIERLKAAAMVKVGILGSAAEAEKTAGSSDEPSSGQTVAEVAEKHEFGIDVPKRSWLREWFDGNEAQLQERLRKVGAEVAAGRLPIKTALDAFGALAVGDIQARIAAGIPPENAPSTKMAKAGDPDAATTPLIDTGQMRSSITWLTEIKTSGNA